MTASGDKVFLEFEIIEPLSMGLSLGDRGTWGSSVSVSPWLQFSIAPSKYPASKQNIYIVSSKDSGSNSPPSIDGKEKKKLSSNIAGNIRFSILPIDADKSERWSYLTYVPEFSDSEYGHEEFLSMVLNLSENEFAQIRNLFVNGKPPSSISIWTPDVESGYAPDGSDKIWDVSSKREVTILGFSLNFSIEKPRVLVGIKKTENEQELQAEEEQKLKQAVIESRQDLQLLCYGLSEIKSSLGGLSKQLSTIIVIAILIAIFMAMHLKLLT